MDFFLIFFFLQFLTVFLVETLLLFKHLKDLLSLTWEEKTIGSVSVQELFVISHLLRLVPLLILDIMRRKQFLTSDVCKNSTKQ